VITLLKAGRFLWCLLGAAAGISAALWAVAPPVSPFLLASLGGSAVFLFGLTRVPAAQPRALFGGHLGAALMGIICYQCFGDALWVYTLAMVLTLGYMLLTRSVHPPAGANPLIMIAGHASFGALWHTVFIGVLTMAAVAFVWSRVFPKTVRYPAKWLDPSPPTSLWGVWNE
jgi:CBS-domain-containing membrane protein